MSAFFTTIETVHDTVQALLKFDGPVRNPNMLGRNLRALNVSAMLQRYPNLKGTQEEADMRQAVEAYVFDIPDSNLAQIVKSVDCLIYQCSEGNVPSHPLYQRIDKLAERMRPKITAPEYANAVWDRCDPDSER